MKPSHPDATPPTGDAPAPTGVGPQAAASTPVSSATPDTSATSDTSETPGTIATPDAAATPFPIVGIGASAGGLAAFEAFFAGMPDDADPGMAFVLVQHLAPDHKSLLSDLMQRCTRMPVFEVADGIVVQPNRAYIIPPGHDMAFRDGALWLLEPSAPRGQRLPIDFFFRSLADELRERAIGIVLSGTGSDGSQGVRAIKGSGGMVMVQTPDSAEYDGMPRSAIGTGLVDYQLPPGEMPGLLIGYATQAFSKPAHDSASPAPDTANALRQIFALLRDQTGHDFSEYKPSTLNRRIDRRMAVHQIEAIGDYVRFLKQKPAEIEALFRDLLIGVTSFFRDPEAFKVLDDLVLPRIFAGKPAGSAIRIWSAGCSTGEEAYSLAILLAEQQEKLRQRYVLQVFATDVDSQAIATARAGIYPASIAADVTPERLARYFVAEADGSTYRIHKSIRDSIVFSEQDVIKDPPFSRLDLISCRNLLIYLGASLQQKLILLFHYALNPGGFLFLGTSESVGESFDLYAVEDRKQKLFRRKETFHGAQRTAGGRLLPLITASGGVLPHPAAKVMAPLKLPLRELTEQTLLQQLAPTAALVNRQGDILYLHGRAGMYLEPAAGEAGVNNVLKMAREGLRRDLTMALHKSVQNTEVVRCAGIRVKTNGHSTTIDLTVCPIAVGPTTTPDSHVYLAIIEKSQPLDLGLARQAPPALSTPGADSDDDTEARIAALKQELRAKEEFLLTTNEELETSNEELKSSNEEMQSVNEELQSTNEELETSKEELQSVNEELATVNAELRSKVLDLSRANNDMNNLLAGTGIATIFVDPQLRILRFTPAATRIINLIVTDVGRPVAHIASNLVGYPSLVADARSVLDTLVPRDRDVQTAEGEWYTLHMQPYRTLDNVIEGVVMTFVNISEIVHTREALKKANEMLRLAVVVRDAHDAITVQDLDGRILAWNPGAVRLYGWTELEALTMNVRDRIPPAQREDALARIRQLSLNEILEPYRTQRLARDGRVIDIWMTATALRDAAGQLYAIATTERAGPPAAAPTPHAPDGRDA